MKQAEQRVYDRQEVKSKGRSEESREQRQRHRESQGVCVVSRRWPTVSTGWEDADSQSRLDRPFEA